MLNSEYTQSDSYSILLSKIVIKCFCKTILFYQNFLDINGPVHDYQNFLHILSSILFRESYSRWVCLRIPNITALGIVANWNFYLGKWLV